MQKKCVSIYIHKKALDLCTDMNTITPHYMLAHTYVYDTKEKHLIFCRHEDSNCAVRTIICVSIQQKLKQ